MADSDQAGPSEQKGDSDEKEQEKAKLRRDRTSGFFEINKRELGRSQPRISSRKIASSEALIKRMHLYAKLYGHKGCVNTVCFNPDGDILVSGSDDKEIIFWDWSMRQKTFSYFSGHVQSVFQARIMPFTDDLTVVSSAGDGQVRVGYIKDGGDVSTKQIGSHGNRVHKLAIEPGSPHNFYSCGEDGTVQHFDLRKTGPTKLFVCSPMPSHHRIYIPLTSIVIDPRNPNFFAVGGFDQFARVYDIRSCSTPQTDPLSSSDRPVNTFCPNHLIKSSERIHITGLSYSNTSELLVSYNDELLYSFSKEAGLGPDPLTGGVNPDQTQIQGYEGHRNAETIKGASYFGLRDEYVVSGSDCGHVYVWRKKGGELVSMMKGDKHVVNCVETHPYFPFLASSGYDNSVKLWTPTACRTVSFPKNAKEVMEKNKSGREEREGAGPDIVMHVLRLQSRRAIAYVQRRTNRRDNGDDDDGERETILLGFSNGDSDDDEDDEDDDDVDLGHHRWNGNRDDGDERDPRECVIC